MKKITYRQVVTRTTKEEVWPLLEHLNTAAAGWSPPAGFLVTLPSRGVIEIWKDPASALRQEDWQEVDRLVTEFRRGASTT